MIPDRKFGRLIFSNPSPGIFTITQDGKTALETDDPKEAKEYIKKYFAQMIDKQLRWRYARRTCCRSLEQEG